MNFKTIEPSKMNQALTTSWTRSLEKKLESCGDLSKPTLTDGQREMLDNRPVHPPVVNQGLFKAHPMAVLNVAFGHPESLSERSRQFDLPYIPKVGGQGASFPSAYMAKCVIPYYTKMRTDFIAATGMTPADQAKLETVCINAVAYAAKVLREQVLPEGGYLDPLSWSDSVFLVCSKDTACNPFGGKKTDPAVIEYLLAHPGELGDGSIMGQRFQRNKTDKEGYPLPRCTFNSDVRDVVQDMRFAAPLTRALQKYAEADPLCPFQDLRGDVAVGASMSYWYNGGNNKPIPFYGIMGDVTGMDQCVCDFHGDLFLKVVSGLFAPEYQEELKASIKRCFSERLIIDADHAVDGPHAMFSGKVWTHILEEIVSWVESLMFVNTVTIVVPSYKDGVVQYERKYDAEHWKEALIQVCGDDVDILIAAPDSARFEWESDAESLEAHWVYIAAILHLDASVEKQAIWKGHSSFCCRDYSPAAVMDSVYGTAFRPVYTPVLAVNGVLNPENVLDDPSITNQLSRACQILDQSFGHERWTEIVTQLYLSIDQADRDKIAELLLTSTDALDSRRCGRFGGYFANSAPDWYAANSPTVALVLKLMKLSTTEVATLRQTLTHVHEMRRLHWLYRINPKHVVHPLVGDESDLRYLMFFDDTGLDMENPKTLRDLTERRGITPEGKIADVRVETQYMPTLTWDQNWVSNTPLSDYQATKQGLKELNRVSNSGQQKGSVIRRKF